MTMKTIPRHLLLLIIPIILLLTLAACNFEREPDQGDIRVEVVADGARNTYTYATLTSVGQLLNAFEIDVSPLDKVNPPQFTQIADGMVITIVRVTEDEECVEEPIQKRTETIANTNLAPGVEEVIDVGQDGLKRVCYRVVYEDGRQVSSTWKNEVTITPSEPRRVYIGVEDRAEPVAIEGTIAYIGNGRAYIMRDNSSLRTPLTQLSGLDGRVFDLSPDGQQLLYTRQTPEEDDLPFSNDLWVILDTTAAVPAETILPLPNVRTASWRPGVSDTFSYSTATPDDILSGWSAYNDLYIMQIDGNTGEPLNIDPIIDINSTGVLAQWGTRFEWSPDGSQLAYARAEEIGLIDLENGEFTALLPFPYYNFVAQRWVWQPQISWSSDSQWIVTTVHGPPFGNESVENSIIFNMGVMKLDPNDTLIVDSLIEQVGLWATPAYSRITTDELGLQSFQIAYLQAREPFNSVSSEYDVWIADRDGSNPRLLFPGTSQRGIKPVESVGEDLFTWSPDGRYIAVVYLGELWIVDVSVGSAQRVTSEGPVEAPRWIE